MTARGTTNRLANGPYIIEEAKTMPKKIDIACWAVFEKSSPRYGPEISSYECVACFADEKSAIEFQMRNPELRERKYIISKSGEA